MKKIICRKRIIFMFMIVSFITIFSCSKEEESKDNLEKKEEIVVVEDQVIEEEVVVPVVQEDIKEEPVVADKIVEISVDITVDEKDDFEIEWVDPFIEKRIRNLLEIPEVAVKYSDVLRIKELDLYREVETYDIMTLEDLKHLKNLKKLWVFGDGVRDIEGLSELTLVEFYMNNFVDDVGCSMPGKFEDITPLKNMLSLEKITLNNSRLSDITALTNLVNLKEVDVLNTSVESVENLMKLPNLERVYCNDIDTALIKGNENIEILKKKRAIIPKNYVVKSENESKVNLENLMTVNNDSEIIITEELLDVLTIENFTIDSIGIGKIDMVVNGKEVLVKNLLNNYFNKDSIPYFFCVTDDEDKQILVVLNTELQKLQWCYYYPKYSHFYSDDLLAFVFTPNKENTQIVEYYLNDFKIDAFRKHEENYYIHENQIVGDRQFYYITPLLEKEEDLLTIFWQQGNYVNTFDQYKLNPSIRNGDLRTNYSADNEITELKTAFSAKTTFIPSNCEILASNVNEKFEVLFVVKEGEEKNWDTIKVISYNKELYEVNEISLASIFEYQDDICSIIPAVNTDANFDFTQIIDNYSPPMSKQFDLKNRICFIIDTVEYMYDAYFDPEQMEFEIFLRPTMYKTLNRM